MATNRMKPGDTAPALLIDTNADMTGTTSKVAKIRRRHGGTVVTKTLTTVGDPTLGVLTYQWVAPDTDVVGTYEIDAVVTFADGRIQHFPQGSDLELIIGEKVG
jgi:hypothetical protein